MKNKRDSFGFPEPDYLPAEKDAELPNPGSKDFEKLPWPDDVPILVKADLLMGRELDRSGHKQRLFDWASIAFPSGLCYQIVRRALEASIDKKIKREWYQSYDWNLKDRLKLVEIWNLVMNWLGYEVNQPDEESEDELPDAFNWD